MKIHRFIGKFDLSVNKAGLTQKELEITGEIAHQIIKVLKLKPGEKIELCDGKNISAIAEILRIGKKKILVKIETLFHQNFAEQNNKKVNLFCAILKKENFELVVQKTTECGVSKIIPIVSARTVKTGLNLERLKKIAKEASEQSGRFDIPEIHEPKNFLEAIAEKGENILFDVNGEKYSYISNSNSPQNIFIGPEGGWTSEEIEKAKSLNFKILSLGPLTLRGETTAIVATYLISNLK